MKLNNLIRIGVILVLLISVSSVIFISNQQSEKEEYVPNDWLLAQRVFPYGHLNPVAYEASRQQAIQVQEELSRMKSSGSEWEFAGPFNVVGRVSDVAVIFPILS